MLPALRSLLIFLLLSGLAQTTAHARLGETMDKLKARFGAPAGFARKEVAVWYFEVQDGEVLYTVTFNAKGLSVAEGLKPVKQAIFNHEIAESFIGSQTEPYKNSKTLHTVRAGEKYHYGGKDFVCAEKEYVVVDEANDFLLIWSTVGIPSIIVIRPELVQ